MGIHEPPAVLAVVWRLVAVSHVWQGSSPRVIRVRELAASANDIIREINESGQPAFLTHLGRFVAMITPLEVEALESAALADVDPADYPDDPDAATPRTGRGGPTSTAEARRAMQART